MTASEYLEFLFLLTYQRFSEVEFFKFNYQDITIIMKKGLPKLFV